MGHWPGPGRADKKNGWAGPGRAKNFENAMGRAGPGRAEKFEYLIGRAVKNENVIDRAGPRPML